MLVLLTALPTEAHTEVEAHTRQSTAPSFTGHQAQEISLNSGALRQPAASSQKPPTPCRGLCREHTYRLQGISMAPILTAAFLGSQGLLSQPWQNSTCPSFLYWKAQGLARRGLPGTLGRTQETGLSPWLGTAQQRGTRQPVLVSRAQCALWGLLVQLPTWDTHGCLIRKPSLHAPPRGQLCCGA